MSHTQPYWQPHPIADLFPRMTPEEWAALKKDMVQRREQGLDPFERPILVSLGTILDGRHRHDAWIELADEGAADGYFAANPPPSEDVAPDEHGSLIAWMRAKSLNLVHRHIPAEQKAAIFLKAVETFPELRAVIEEIAQENAARKKDGQPLVAGDRRGNTNEQIGQLAGVGATTMKAVKRLKAAAPDQFEAVAQGKRSVKKAFKQLGTGKPPAPKAKKDGPKEKPESADGPATEAMDGGNEWDIEFTACGYVPQLAGKRPIDIQTGLKDDTLKLVWTGRLEEPDGTLVAEITCPDFKGFTVSDG